MLCKNKSQGFTLIELMVVIVIIGILAAIAIPKFMEASVKAKCSEIPTVVAAYDHAQLAYLAENSSLAAAEGNLIFDKPTNSKWFSYTYTPGASTIFSAAVATGKAVGSLSDASTGPTSTITSTGVPVHQSNAFSRYLPNFQ